MAVWFGMRAHCCLSSLLLAVTGHAVQCSRSAPQSNAQALCALVQHELQSTTIPNQGTRCPLRGLLPAFTIGKGCQSRQNPGSVHSPRQNETDQQHYHHADGDGGTARIEVLGFAVGAWHRAVLAENNSVCCDEGQEHSILVLRLRSQAKQPGVNADDCCQGHWAAPADVARLMWGSHMSMYKNASGKAMVWQWDQKAIARLQLCSSKMLSSLTLLHPPVHLWLWSMPQPAVLSDVTELWLWFQSLTV